MTQRDCPPIFINMKTTPAGPHNYYHYGIQNKFRARALRKSMTNAEKVLWQMIRRKQIHGYTFNRQRPVMNYIADFMCKDLRLIIEVDGWVHDLPEQQYRDQQREKALRQTGFSILRFKNWEVLYDPAGVFADIKRWVEEAMRRGGDTDFASPRHPSKGE